MYRAYEREKRRRLRGSVTVRARRFICECCGKDLVQNTSRTTVCSNKCGVKRWRDKRRQQRSYTVPLDAATAARSQTKQEELQRAEITRAKANTELARLIDEQERDLRLGHLASRGTISLDAVVLEDGSERYEWVESADLDPAAILEQEEHAAAVNAVLGGISEEKAQRLNYATQEWLAAKLRDNGLVGISVTRTERERLRMPTAHAGSEVADAGSYGGRMKRREKVAAGRHSRPSKKPRKRWDREDWELAA